MSAATVDPEAPLTVLRGIGPRIAARLAADGVERVADLVLRVPLRYEDRTRLVPLASVCEEGRWVLVRARAAGVRSRRGRRRRTTLVEAVLDDGSARLAAVWFNQAWVVDLLRTGEPLYLYGPVRRSRAGRLQLVNAEVEEADPDRPGERVVPVYRQVGGLRGRRLRRLVEQALELLGAMPDPLPPELRRRLRMPSLGDALRAIHAPDPADPGSVATRARDRLAFDELLAFACGVAELRRQRQERPSPGCVVTASPAELAARVLPFRLTGAQERVVREIAADLAAGPPMARLVQGDVGSGKTAVAALAMLMVLDSGSQAVLMAPTELLAEQHHRTLTRLFRETGIRPGLLCGSLPAGERRAVRAGLSRGDVRLVVGTHAVIQEGVRFRRLGLAVVDEQHRFGVIHRQALVDKGPAPNLLVMTATPIPRSLALTVYGDLEVSVVDELPPGRRPVRTVLRTAAAKPRLFEFLRGEIAAGGRVFVVCPLIEPSEQIAARAVAEHVDEVQEALPEARLGVLHGRVSRQEREEVSARFRTGEVQVLLATTVVEVGVDVPEASVMVIESAERFGLSQLHQLRGRVGRGARQSWCVLLAGDDVSEESRRRLELFCTTEDGFAIAEADLRLRGPGELTGTRQWGPSHFRFASLVRHRRLVERAREVARGLADDRCLADVKAELARYHPVDIDLPAG